MPGPYLNTDTELYREPKGDLPSDYYANSISITEPGLICLSVGGRVICDTIAGWHELAAKRLPKPEPTEY